MQYNGHHNSKVVLTETQNLENINRQFFLSKITILNADSTHIHYGLLKKTMISNAVTERGIRDPESGPSQNFSKNIVYYIKNNFIIFLK